MKKKEKLILAAGFLAAFALWTMVLCLVDRQPIGPRGSMVGLGGWNQWVHGLTGVRLDLYVITDWLGLVPIGICGVFALLGLWQWIMRKSLKKVDRDLLLLGGFYLAVMGAYLLFEKVVINYRPVLLNGRLEVSYPSSTTMLVLCIMPTAMMQIKRRLGRGWRSKLLWVAVLIFTVLMVAGRFLSGVHWVTDIVGGILLSAGLVTLYDGLSA